MTWDYDSARAGLSRLYERAKSHQCNGRTDLPWETDVDQEAVVRANAERQGGLAPAVDVTATPAERWGDREWPQFRVESQNWTMSQFLHGEQGGLVCAAKIRLHPGADHRTAPARAARGVGAVDRRQVFAATHCCWTM